MKILSIDDSKSVHAYIKFCFASAKVDLMQAFSGEEGIKILEANGSVDLVLLDWEMPGMNGPETLKAIKEKWPNIAICMVTTKNALEDMALVMELGANDYVMKPFTKEILFEKISNIVGKEIETQ